MQTIVLMKLRKQGLMLLRAVNEIHDLSKAVSLTSISAQLCLYVIKFLYSRGPDQFQISCTDVLAESFIFGLIFLTVPDPTVTANGVSAAVNSSADLTCSVSDNPTGTTITYQWKRNGMTVATSATYQVSSSVNVSDAGVYTCEATVSDTSNSSHVIPGSGSEDVTLTVTSK